MSEASDSLSSNGKMNCRKTKQALFYVNETIVGADVTGLGFELLLTDQGHFTFPTVSFIL